MSTSMRMDCMDGEVVDWLPLVANLDALFDSGFISFDRDGVVLISPALGEEAGLLDNIPRRLRQRPTQEQAIFLQYHTESVFEHATVDELKF